jgi:hypothetical protein
MSVEIGNANLQAKDTKARTAQRKNLREQAQVLSLCFQLLVVAIGVIKRGKCKVVQDRGPVQGEGLQP